MGILIAATLAKEGDEICLDNQSAAGASYTDPHSEATDHDIHTKVAALVIAKNLRVRWIRSHRDPSKATSYEDYLDRVGNQIADTLANEGGARLLQREKTEGHDGDITADGIMMPSPARKWLLAMRPQPEVSCHWTSWKPLRGMSRSWWAPWLWAQSGGATTTGHRGINRRCRALDARAHTVPPHNDASRNARPKGTFGNTG